MNFRELLETSSLRRLSLIELLCASQIGLSSDQLLEELNCSLPALLKDIQFINNENDTFHIEKFKGIYKLHVKKNTSINQLYSNVIQQSPELQIIEELLYENCSTINDLAKKLYLSTSNTQRCLKKIEMVVEKAGIKLCYRPLRIEGEERIVRYFYYRYFLDKFEDLILCIDLKNYQIRSIIELVNHFIQVNHLKECSILKKHLVHNIYISLWRIKNHHFFPADQLISSLDLPNKEILDAFEEMTLDVFRFRLTKKQIKDCLWLSYSNTLIFNEEQWKSTMKQNTEYRNLYQCHYELVENFNYLLNQALTDEEMKELTIYLLNDQGLYTPNGRYIDILYPQRKVFIEKMLETHYLAIIKILKMVEQFVTKYRIYQEKDFVWNYVYLLITKIPKSVILLGKSSYPLKILFISKLSSTEERFFAKQIEEHVYGNFKIHFTEECFSNGFVDIKKLVQYDGLIASSSVNGIPYNFPTVVLNPFLTVQNLVQIQQMITDLSV